jgi:branched-chain amino acid aminotransferase
VNRAIAVTRAAVRKPKPQDSELGFGAVFTDHMAVMTYEEGRGWHDLRL